MTVRLGLSEVQSSNEFAHADSIFKIPDLLIYDVEGLTSKQKELLEKTDLVKVKELTFKPGGELRFAIEKALAAIEVEFSPYKAKEMSGRNWQPRTLGKWESRPLKNATSPTAPNIFVKEEDLGKLMAWEKEFSLPIVVVHVFDQEAFAIRLKQVAKFDKKLASNAADHVKLQVTCGIFKKVMKYNRIDAQGAGEEKTVFMIPPCTAVKVGDVLDVKVEAQLALSSSKKYVSQILFSNGKLNVSEKFLKFLKEARSL